MTHALCAPGGSEIEGRLHLYLPIIICVDSHMRVGHW
nr:MAG TPA: hypothetical protein [Caudoviricetes sp.]